MELTSSVVDIGAVCNHAAGTDREREEDQTHGIEKRLPAEFGKIRQEEIFHAFHGTGLHQTCDDQNDHEDKQHRHEDLGTQFDAASNAKGNHKSD